MKFTRSHHAIDCIPAIAGLFVSGSLGSVDPIDIRAEDRLVTIARPEKMSALDSASRKK